LADWEGVEGEDGRQKNVSAETKRRKCTWSSAENGMDQHLVGGRGGPNRWVER
jgi:hypothetical protein